MNRKGVLYFNIALAGVFIIILIVMLSKYNIGTGTLGLSTQTATTKVNNLEKKLIECENNNLKNNRLLNNRQGQIHALTNEIRYLKNALKT